MLLPATVAPPIFNQAELLDRVGGDTETAVEILTIFLEVTPGQIDALHLATETQNDKQVKDLAHSLKGAAGSISAAALQEVAFKIEQAGKKGALSAISPLILQLTEEFAKLQKELTRYLTARSS